MSLVFSDHVPCVVWPCPLWIQFRKITRILTYLLRLTFKEEKYKKADQELTDFKKKGVSAEKAFEKEKASLQKAIDKEKALVEKANKALDKKGLAELMTNLDALQSGSIDLQRQVCQTHPFTDTHLTKPHPNHTQTIPSHT